MNVAEGWLCGFCEDRYKPERVVTPVAASVGSVVAGIGSSSALPSVLRGLALPNSSGFGLAIIGHHAQ